VTWVRLGFCLFGISFDFLMVFGLFLFFPFFFCFFYFFFFFFYLRRLYCSPSFGGKYSLSASVFCFEPALHGVFLLPGNELEVTIPVQAELTPTVEGAATFSVSLR